MFIRVLVSYSERLKGCLTVAWITRIVKEKIKKENYSYEHVNYNAIMNRIVVTGYLKEQWEVVEQSLKKNPVNIVRVM